MLYIKCSGILQVIIRVIIFFSHLSYGDEGGAPPNAIPPPTEDDLLVPGETSDTIAAVHTVLPKDLQFQVLNRTDVEKECKAIVKCWSSDKDLWICANDDRVYQNPGVLVCAQVCNTNLELEIFCRMNPGDFQVDDKDHCANCRKRSTSEATDTLLQVTEALQQAEEGAAAAAQTASETAAAAAANPKDADAANNAADAAAMAIEASAAVTAAEAAVKAAKDNYAAAAAKSKARPLN